MKNYAFKILLGLVVLLFVLGCDEVIVSNEQEIVGMKTIESGDTLFTCRKSSTGKLVFAEDSGKVLYCNGEEWRDLNGIDGKNGADGVDGKDGEDGYDGYNGYAGSSCSAKLDGSVYTIACGQDTVVIDLLIQAPSRCSVREGEESYTLICGEDSAVIEIGPSLVVGKGCTTVDLGNGTVTRTCVGKTEIFYKAVCGDTPYDPDGEKFCHGVTLYPKCGDKAYDVDGQICIMDGLEGHVYAKCGTDFFDPEESFCLNETVYPLCNGKSYLPGERFCQNDSLYLNCDGKSIYARDYACVAGVITGSVEDADGRVYRTAVLGSLEWMAENLLVKTGTSQKISDSDADELYGMLYSRDDALNVCPDGWRLPSSSNYVMLRTQANAYIQKYFVERDVLKVLGANGYWDGVATWDSFGLSFVPDAPGALVAKYWTSSEKSDGSVVLATIGLDGVSTTTIDNTGYFHVRCVRSFE